MISYIDLKFPHTMLLLYLWALLYLFSTSFAFDHFFYCWLWRTSLFHVYHFTDVSCHEYEFKYVSWLPPYSETGYIVFWKWTQQMDTHLSQTTSHFRVIDLPQILNRTTISLLTVFVYKRNHNVLTWCVITEFCYFLCFFQTIKI